MKTFVVKTVYSAILCCGVSFLSFNVQAADVSNWSDLVDALSSGDNVNVDEDIVANQGGGTITAVYDDGEVVSQDINGNRSILGGNGYNGFAVSEGAKFRIDNIGGTAAIIDDEFIGFDKFLVNKGETIIASSKLNYNEDKSGVGGSVVYNEGSISIENSDIFSNVVKGTSGDIMGGAVYNYNVANISDSDFSGNEISGTNGANSYGGAIYNLGGEMVISDTSFYDNKAVSDTGYAQGGAIYSLGSLKLVATQGNTMTFSGNGVCSGVCDEIETNDIYMKNGNLALNPEGGTIEFLGGINGEEYSIDVQGGGTVSLYSTIKNVTTITLNSSTLHLSSSGAIDTGSFIMKNSPTVKLDVMFLADNDGNITGGKTGKISVSGDVEGNANIVVNASDATILDGSKSVVFLEAPNDDLTTETSFNVTRVITSPYMWDTKVEYGDDSGSTWYIYMTDEPNTSGEGARALTPEVVAYIGVPGVVMEQHKNMIDSIKNKVSSNKFPAQGKYGMWEDHYKNQAGLNMWVTPAYSYADITSPVETEADIAGADIGFDVQGDINNKVGIFASYRRGEYDFNGKGEEYSSELSSDITDNSFMLGVYYRYDKDNFWSFSTLYGGRHSMDISVEDGEVSEEVKATQYGASFEMGHTFVPAHNLTLDPSLGVFYTGADIDSIEDDFAKTAKYDLMHVFEGELSLKLEKTFDYGFGYSKVYIKPSIIRSLVVGNSVDITGLGELDDYDNQTMGRIEIGGRIAIDDRLSVYGYTNYTSGSDYSNVSAGLGLNYRLQ